MTTTQGGFGGFFASVLVNGVTGQHEQQSKVSALEEVLGGGGGSFLSAGGGTNPSSFEPSPAKTVPAHKVNPSNSFIFISPPYYHVRRESQGYIVYVNLDLSG